MVLAEIDLPVPSWRPRADFLSVLSAQPLTLLQDCLLRAHPSCSPALLLPRGGHCCLSAPFLAHPWRCLLLGRPRSGTLAVAEGREQGIVTRNNGFITNSVGCFSMFLLLLLRRPGVLCFLHSPVLSPAHAQPTSCPRLRPRGWRRRGSSPWPHGANFQMHAELRKPPPRTFPGRGGGRPRSERMSRRKRRVAHRPGCSSTPRPMRGQRRAQRRVRVGSAPAQRSPSEPGGLQHRGDGDGWASIQLFHQLCAAELTDPGDGAALPLHVTACGQSAGRNRCRRSCPGRRKLVLRLPGLWIEPHVAPYPAPPDGARITEPRVHHSPREELSARSRCAHLGTPTGSSGGAERNRCLPSAPSAAPPLSPSG